jgi:hypothetical protein
MMPYEIAEEEGNLDCCEILKNRPPEIVHFMITKCTETSITVDWNPSLYKPQSHSKVLEYIVEWIPIINLEEYSDLKTTHYLNQDHRYLYMYIYMYINIYVYIYIYIYTYA